MLDNVGVELGKELLEEDGGIESVGLTELGYITP